MKLDRYVLFKKEGLKFTIILKISLKYKNLKLLNTIFFSKILTLLLVF